MGTTAPTIRLGIDQVLKLAAKGDLPALKAALDCDPGLLHAMSDGHKRTFVWEAANANRLETLQYLVEKGAPFDVPGRYRSHDLVLLTPYCVAVKKKRQKIADFLLRHGARIDTYSAAFLGDMATLQAHVEAAPDSVNALHPDDTAWDVVPLHYAVAGEQAETVAYLIENGTDLARHGPLLLDMVCRLGRPDLARLLVDGGADPATAPVFAVLYTGDPEIMEYFFARGVDPDHKDGITDWPPIAYVSRGDKGEHPERVEALLRYGADINAAGPKGVTALHAAAKAGFVRVIEVLLNAGADTAARTKAGETPLDLARKNKRSAAVALLQHA